MPVEFYSTYKHDSIPHIADDDGAQTADTLSGKTKSRLVYFTSFILLSCCMNK